jgi:Ca2+-binding EF-hand superfamily protein
MYKQFKKETPSGQIGKTEFRDVMKQMGVADTFLQDLIFNVFDTNKVCNRHSQKNDNSAGWLD